jgi:hypothetical protein
MCDFVQYRPASAFEDEVLDITPVTRDRAWFKRALPTLYEFISDLDAIREGRLDPPASRSKLDLSESLTFKPCLQPAAVCKVRMLDEETDDEVGPV